MKKTDYQSAQTPEHEVERLRALKSLNILDTSSELALDEMTTLASQICDTPISLITLVDEKRQWFKSKKGFELSETAREVSFSAHAVYSFKTLTVEDATLDPRFKHNPLVTGEPHIRFYAGAPLITSDGYAIGTICVIDHKPRQLTPGQINSLEILSKQIIQKLERRKIERELMVQKNFFSSIVNILPQLVCYIDTDYQYLFRNEAYQRWFHKSPQDINVTSMKEIIGEQTFNNVKHHIDKVLSGEAHQFEKYIKLEINGHTYDKTINANYIPDLDANGKARGFFAVITDLTEQKNRENMIIEQGELLELALKNSRASEQKFRAYFENSAVGMVRFNSKMQFLDANPAYLQMIEYTLPELQSMDVSEVAYPEDLVASREQFNKLMTEKIPVLRYEKRSVTKSGKVLWMQVSGQAIEIEDGNDFQVFVMAQDVTALKQAENLLHEQQLKMIQASKMSALGEMAGGVAHEINNPLAIILGKLEKLKWIYQEDRENEVIFFQELEKVRLTAIRISKIIRGLRSFSRDGSGEPFEKIGLNTIISNTVALCSERFLSSGIELIYNEDSDIQIECHSTEVSQILLNLLNNAHDAIQHSVKKWIKIETKFENDSVQIAVIDSGAGISANVREKIMQPFFTTKEVGKGTGLGLSIAKGLAEAHHGELFLDLTAPNTKFIVSLPLSQATYTDKL